MGLLRRFSSRRLIEDGEGGDKTKSEGRRSIFRKRSSRYSSPSMKLVSVETMSVATEDKSVVEVMQDESTKLTNSPQESEVVEEDDSPVDLVAEDEPKQKETPDTEERELGSTNQEKLINAQPKSMSVWIKVFLIFLVPTVAVFIATQMQPDLVNSTVSQCQGQLQDVTKEVAELVTKYQNQLQEKANEIVAYFTQEDQILEETKKGFLFKRN